MKITAETHPYRVRKQSSGYGVSEKWIVVKLREGDTAQRVSVHAHHSKEGALLAADDLNITHQTPLAADDPRPFAERRAETAANYTPLPPLMEAARHEAHRQAEADPPEARGGDRHADAVREKVAVLVA